MKHQIAIFASLSIVFSLALWTVYQSHRATAQSKETARTIPVSTVIVTRDSFQPTDSFSGFLRGENQTDLRANISGLVTSIRREPGERVQQGEVLATLSEANIASQNASAALSVSAAENTLDATKRYYNQKINEAEAALKKTKESKLSGDATTKDVHVAEESVASAKRLRDTEISRAEAAVAAAKGGQMISKASESDLIIRAPFSGVVLRRDISIGSRAFPGDTLFALASTENRELSVSVPVSVAKELTINSTVSLKAENGSEPFTGTIDSYAVASDDQTGETRVRIRISSTTNKMLPPVGTFTTVELPLQNIANTIAIPTSAIVFRYGDPIVFIIENGHAIAKTVELGQDSGDHQEIISGLNAGDEIVTAGMHALREGDDVLVSQEASVQ